MIRYTFNLFMLNSLFCCFVSAQNSFTDSIDVNLHKKFHELTAKAAYDETKDLIINTLDLAKKNNYEKGIYWSYLRLGNLECTLNNYKESIKYLDNAKVILNRTNDIDAMAVLEIEYGRLYSKSKHSYNDAIESFKRGIELSKKIKNEKIKRSHLTFIYQNLFVTYWFLEDKDNSIKALHNAENTISDIYNLTYLAYHHLTETKNNDSIIYYLKKSDNFLQNKPHFKLEQAVLHNQWGNYFENIKLFDSAIIKYKLGYELSKKINNNHDLMIAIEGLSRSYGEIGEYEQKSKYLIELSQIKDSTIINIKDEEKEATKLILNTKIKETEFKYKQLVWGFVIVLALLTFIIYYFSKQKKVKQNIIENQEKKILEIEEDKLLLEKKNEITFDELVQLAKANNVEFFTRFQEAYPAFISKIKKINPDLKVSELTLLAYIYLGFNNKDIAYYTYKSTFTIRNRKHKVRKKLNIESDEDFELYLKAIINES